MSGVKGFLGSKLPDPNFEPSLHALGRPWPDSSTYTSNFLASPRNAMPVGKLRPCAKTETVKPCGRMMSSPLPGLNLAVSCGQIGFVTVVTWALAGEPGQARHSATPDSSAMDSRFVNAAM